MFAILLALIGTVTSQSLLDKGGVIQVVKPTDSSHYNHYNFDGDVEEGDIIIQKTVSFSFYSIVELFTISQD